MLEIEMVTPASPDGTTPLQLISPDGAGWLPRAEMGIEELSDNHLRGMLRWLFLARAVDDEAMALQAAGELTVYPPFRGQEAAQVGSALALAPQDFVFPTFRELAAALVRGVDAVTYFEYHRGTWHGGAYDPLASRFGPVCIILASQVVHAVGFAMGQRMLGSDVVTLAYFGDGSSSEGDFHEAANFAAVFDAPVVLFCQNNHWAISMHESKQMRAPVVAKAAGYGIPGVQVDGNDVLAVWRATRDAAARARAGDGPTLIEAITYRMGPHHTADDPARYRDPAEHAAWLARDPIVRFERWLTAESLVTTESVAQMRADVAAEVAQIAEGVRSLAPPSVAALFDWAYAEPHADLLTQREDIARFAGPGAGGDA